MPVHLVDHPIAHDALAALRDKTTRPSHFRRLAHRLSLVLAVEATRDLETRRLRVDTPLEPADGRVLAGDVVVVPVLRAGLGMVEAVLEVLPHARVGHIGLQRDEHTAIASQYYTKLPPDLSRSVVLIVDPMLATGGSAVAAIRMLDQAGARDVRLVCIVAAPEGIAAVEAARPDVRIFTPAIDRGLNASKFILPGLGDFGDRLYATL
ncbi:MAG: uracil phosphoribosyltransferase [Vicinamibacterales bacterium]